MAEKTTDMFRKTYSPEQVKKYKKRREKAKMGKASRKRNRPAK